MCLNKPRDFWKIGVTPQAVRSTLLNPKKMCLNPLKIINPKCRFSTKGFHPLVLQVPCGKCAECQEKKQNEYKVRSYYEALSTFDANGFIINDTLTYSNENLPHLSDEDSFFETSKYNYPCFNHTHFRLFMVRLREMAKERLNIPPSSIKYFMAAEYGTTEGKTHRPHLHVLFFVRGSFDPVEFSYLISDMWPYGRTDGVRFKGRTYFFNKRCFSRSSNNNVLHLTNVAKYVCKYLVKDSSFQNVIDKRLCACMFSKYGDDWKNNQDALEYYKKLSRNVCQFHRNSQKFGLDALKYNDIDEVLNTGMLSMKSSSNVIQHVPLPMYFKRKLFYELTKDFRGQPQWRLTPKGVCWKMNRVNDSIAYLATRFASWHEQLLVDGQKAFYDISKNYLGARSWNDFAKYLLCYKGRILPYIHHQKARDEHFAINCSPVPLDIAITLAFDNDNGVNEFYNYYDKETKCITFQFHGDKFCPRSDFHGRSFQTILDYQRFWVIHEDTYNDFKDFDKLFNIFCASNYPLNQAKQKAYDLKLHLKQILGNIAA